MSHPLFPGATSSQLPLNCKKVQRSVSIAAVKQHQPPSIAEEQHTQQWGYIRPGSASWTFDDDLAEPAKVPSPSLTSTTSPRQQRLLAQQQATAAAAPTVINQLPDHLGRAVINNAILLIDKPPEWSAMDVVRAIRLAFKLKKVGHTGPLDNMATGLMIICLGHATQLTPRFAPLERVYTGTIRLGVTTTTYDATGKQVNDMPWSHITDDDIQAAVHKLRGDTQQTPPMWCGTKHKGEPMSWYAERGEEIERQSRTVHVADLDVWREPGSRELSFKAVVSKGTSMRCLAHDLGRALACGAHLSSLRREAVGGFLVDNAWTLDVLIPLVRKYRKGFRETARPQRPQ
eukprot:jgi/Chrzof1/14477/Cz09g04080.t1